jgi:hypothetical protein
MEVKRPGEDPTRIHAHRMREMAKVGCTVTVVRSVGYAREFLEAIE